MSRTLTYQDYAGMMVKQAEINEMREQEEDAKVEAFFDGTQWSAEDQENLRERQRSAELKCKEEYQRAIDAQLRIRLPNDYAIIEKTPLVVGGLTRFDPSTKTWVPVTQRWVDEVVAEIVRLNIEIGNGLASKASAMLSEPNQFSDAVLSESDRIWEAIKAASVV